MHHNIPRRPITAVADTVIECKNRTIAMERIGRYEIVSELGRGAMGVVYRARDPKIGREVAVKTIRLGNHADASEIGELRLRLFREAQSAGRLSHPGIVTIFDVDEKDGLAFITMELVEGEQLSRSRAASLEIGPKIAFLNELLGMAGSALDYAHSRGIVHRDIKPANIMVTESGIKIMDFGVAHIASSQLTRTGTMVGTPNYMSPEQVRGDPVDGRSDQFSLAVIVYELLTGKKPFDTGNVTSTIYRLVNEDPHAPRTLAPNVSPELERVLLRAMSKDPAKRFSSCGAFARAFASTPRMPTQSAAPPAESPREPNSDEDETAADVSSPVVVLADETLASSPARRLPDSTRQIPRGRRLNRTLDPAQPREPARPGGSRWPVVIFVLLLVAIGTLSVLLVRYPGLLEDPQTFIDAILGTDLSSPQPAVPVEPEPASLVAVPPALAVEVPVADPVEVGTAPSSEVLAPVAEPAEIAQEKSGAGDEDFPASQANPQAQLASTMALVTFTSFVDRVQVSVDENPAWRCVTPCEPMQLPVGEHSVVANREGYGLQRRTITVNQGNMTLDLWLEPRQSALVIGSEPTGAKIFVDGRDTGKVTANRVFVSPGRHSIRIVKGSLEASRTIEVQASETQHLNFRLGTN